MTRNRFENGFTMVEILIVIAVMGILSVIGMDNFIFSQKKARDASRKSDLANIAKALELYYNDFSRYPLGQNGAIMGCGTGGVMQCSWNGSTAFSSDRAVYMQKLTKDIEITKRYYYISDGKTFGLYAMLENQLDSAYHTGGITGTNCLVTGTALCNYYLSQGGVEMP